MINSQKRNRVLWSVCFVIGLLSSATKANEFLRYYFPPQENLNQVITTQVCIYGGTSCGVVAALELKRLGINSVIIHPGARIGGLSASGLGNTDIGNKDAIHGISHEFYQRVGAKYGVAEDWTFEPSVALEVFQDMVAEAGVNVYYKAYLDRNNGVVMSGSRIVRIVTENGLTVNANYFIDATYEGDLMAAAGVTFTTGREGNTMYGESHNGQQVLAKHQFNYNISPYVVAGNPASGLLPGIETTTPVIGEGDHRVQAYNFRMCLTQVTANRIPFEQPAGYDRSWYVLLERYLAAGWNEVFNKFDSINNGKTDTNNHGAVSTDFIGQNYGWPDGTYQEREQIFQSHVTYQKGIMWFLANDPAVPQTIRTQMSTWGLAADEFEETGGWPPQLYIREARRMVSDYVITENDVTGTYLVRDSVGLAAYNMDSHNCRRFVNSSGFVKNEGDVQVSITPYPLSYRAIIPRVGECSNLAVPVCVSASHITYGSLRMEPVFMILGQSAAVAIAQAIPGNSNLQDVDAEELQVVLENRGQRLYWLIYPDPNDEIEGVILDSEDSAGIEITGSWQEGTATAGYHGMNYLHDDNTGKGSKSVLFHLNPLTTGRYSVYLRWTALSNRASNVPVTVNHDGGQANHILNQQSNGSQWNLLGSYTFSAATGSVVVSNANTDGYVIADAVLLSQSLSTCSEVIAAGQRMTSDLSGPDGQPDCRVDIYDLLEMANQWLTSF